MRGRRQMNAPRNRAGVPWTIVLLAALTGCSETATLPFSAGIGPQPVLPPPKTALIPTLHYARAQGWAADAAPTPVAGTQVAAFATTLDHPRWLYLLPNGDVLVAETGAPPQPADAVGLRGWLLSLVLAQTGASAVSANRITLLRDSTGSGMADTRSVLLTGLHSPFGMALVGEDLYVANTDAVMRFRYHTGDLTIRQPGVKVVDLPAGVINHHWTKNLIASADGQHLYVTVGSNSNAGDRGPAAEVERAAIWEIDLRTGLHRVFASGLRNANGLAWEPDTGALWTVVNERDELGSDLVPDYLTAVHPGAFYGWPYSYFGAHPDARALPPRPDLVATAVVPDYALGAHTASLGLVWSAGTQLPDAFSEGMFVGQHGSINRRPFSGYKVIFVPFRHGKPLPGAPLDVLTGFLSTDERANGRPVGVILDQQGALLVADDVGNTIWRVSRQRVMRAGAAPVAAASRYRALHGELVSTPQAKH